MKQKREKHLELCAKHGTIPKVFVLVPRHHAAIDRMTLEMKTLFMRKKYVCFDCWDENCAVSLFRGIARAKWNSRQKKQFRKRKCEKLS